MKAVVGSVNGSSVVYGLQPLPDCFALLQLAAKLGCTQEGMLKPAGQIKLVVVAAPSRSHMCTRRSFCPPYLLTQLILTQMIQCMGAPSNRAAATCATTSSTPRR